MATSKSQRLNHLFSTVHGPNSAPHTNEEVANRVREGSLKSPSRYLDAGMLDAFRSGDLAAMDDSQLAAVASFFGIPSAYFIDEVLEKNVNEELARLVRLREAGVSQDALVILLSQIPPHVLQDSPDRWVDMVISMAKAKGAKSES